MAQIVSYTGATGPFQMLAYSADNQIVSIAGATGLNLSLSTPTVTYDSWLLSNMISAPPAPELIATVKQPDDLFIIFKYPQQYQIGMLNTLVPFINDAVLTVPNGSGNNLITNQQSKDFYKSLISESSPVQCLHFYKSNTNTQTGNYTYNSVNYKTSHFQLVTGNYIFYYKNYNTTSLYNALTINISYSSAGYPSNAYTSGQSPTSGTIILSFPTLTSKVEGGGNSKTITINLNSDEVYSDNINGYLIDSTYPLTNVITYSSIPNSNSVRYVSSGDATKQPLTNSLTKILTSSPSSPSYQITSSIYPDTVYTFQLTSTNKSNKQTITSILSMSESSFVSPGINIKALNSNYNFISSNSLNNMFSLNPLTTTLAIPIGSTTSVNVITNTSSNITGTVNYNVQNSFENRGKLSSVGVNNVSMSLNLNGAIATSTPFDIKNTWSGTAQSVGVTSGNIQLIPGTLIDLNLNTALDNDAYSGYYALCPLSINIATSTYLTSASPSPYTVTVSGTYPTTNAPSGTQNPLTYKYTSQEFYYDGPLPTPTCTINGLTINSTTPPIQISGITLYNDAINVTPGITVSNIGTHFYNATRTVDYSGKFGTISTTVTKNNGESKETGLPSGYTSSTKSGTFTNLLTFTKKPNIYSTSLSLTATAYAISGSGVSGSKTLDIIYDTNSVLVSSINNVDYSTLVSGFRVWSGTSLGSEAVGATTLATLTSDNNKSFSDNDFSTYKNAIDITTCNELLFANNAYTTYPTYMINYSNGPNYSSLTNTTSGLAKGTIYYRYATFAWKVNTANLGSTGFSNIQFILSSYSTSQGVSITSNGSLQINSILPFLYYRVEDSSSITDFTNSASTPWINGNLFNNATKISSSNFTSTSTNYSGLDSTTSVSISSINDSSNIIFNTILPNPLKNSSGSSVYIYCRIGIPISVSFSFQDIKCKLM